MKRQKDQELKYIKIKQHVGKYNIITPYSK